MDEEARQHRFERTSDKPPYTGRLLVATPVLTEGSFHRSVVLVLDHDDDGTLGVIVNHPLEVPVVDVLGDWSARASEPPVLFGGGPVATDSALAVGLLLDHATEAPLGWRPMFGRVGLLDLDAPVEVVAGALAGLRIFAGYAGWSAGQLDDEIAEGAWLCLPSLDDDLLTQHPNRLWSEVLGRQPGEERLLATYPADPQMN